MELNIFRKRRSIYPAQFKNEIIPDDTVWEILKDANNSPSHKHTEPWRFRVYSGASRKDLGVLLADAYKKSVTNDQFSEMKYNKTMQKPIQSSHVIVICMKRHADSGIPEWEEIAATACSVQNIYLSCTARGLGCYWSSPKTICSENNILNLPPDQKCLGLVYLGIPKDDVVSNVQKGDVRQKTTWRG